ncbi:DUF6265 family protein [Saccharicrinis sp. FJH62]|uniref:DUF6265 family protein n=1 Tax=Saccharicrinis sp. FJH62 TaxID=3344657 RepID=UPI0035D47CCD
MKKLAFALVAFFVLQLYASGQNEFPNTMFYNDSVGSPKADLSVIAWLQGHWRGEAFGGITEEIWTPPLGGSMMGAFKLVSEDKVTFYELETISEENETLILRLKHFHSDLKGWEEKDKTVDFKLVKVTSGKVYFEGFTIERLNKNEINMYVVIEDDNKTAEVKFNYHRVTD